MELERLASAVRPRRPWEAMDLGFRLAQAWWWPVQRAWLMTALPCFVLAELLLWNHPDWAPVLFWWLKPLYERAPLEVLAQAQFGHVPGWRELSQALPRLFGRQALQALSVRRLSLSRSFKTPVMQLEGLGGEARRRRLAVLAQGGNRRGARWLIFGCMHLEVLFYGAALGLLALLLPREVELDWQGILTGDDHGWMRLLGFAGFIGTALVAPFYVAGGFALYLNRRTELEGWDIELAFRRLKQRLAAGLAASLALGLALLLALPAGPAWAAADKPAAPAPASPEAEARAAIDARHPPSPAQQAARRAIAAVLAGPEFHGMDTEGHWRLKRLAEARQPDRPSDLSGLGAALAAGFKLLLWLALGLLLLFLARRSPRWSRWLARNPRLKAGSAALPQQIAGLDVRPESLPADVAGAAEALARAGHARAALGLLYRASLAALLAARALPLRASHTEGEILCLAAAAQAGAPWLGYLARLIRAWQASAYGRRAPAPEALLALCRDWRGAFGEGGEAQPGTEAQP